MHPFVSSHFDDRGAETRTDPSADSDDCESTEEDESLSEIDGYWTTVSFSPQALVKHTPLISELEEAIDGNELLRIPVILEVIQKTSDAELFATASEHLFLRLHSKLRTKSISHARLGLLLNSLFEQPEFAKIYFRLQVNFRTLLGVLLYECEGSLLARVKQLLSLRSQITDLHCQHEAHWFGLYEDILRHLFNPQFEQHVSTEHHKIVQYVAQHRVCQQIAAFTISQFDSAFRFPDELKSLVPWLANHHMFDMTVVTSVTEHQHQFFSWLVKLADERVLYRFMQHYCKPQVQLFLAQRYLDSVSQPYDRRAAQLTGKLGWLQEVANEFAAPSRPAEENWQSDKASDVTSYPSKYTSPWWAEGRIAIETRIDSPQPLFAMVHHDELPYRKLSHEASNELRAPLIATTRAKQATSHRWAKVSLAAFERRVPKIALSAAHVHPDKASISAMRARRQQAEARLRARREKRSAEQTLVGRAKRPRK